MKRKHHGQPASPASHIMKAATRSQPSQAVLPLVTDVLTDHNNNCLHYVLCAPLEKQYVYPCRQDFQYIILCNQVNILYKYIHIHVRTLCTVHVRMQWSSVQQYRVLQCRVGDMVHRINENLMFFLHCCHLHKLLSITETGYSKTLNGQHGKIKKLHIRMYYTVHAQTANVSHHTNSWLLGNSQQIHLAMPYV